MKLSKSAWNNVIIFSVLAMILVINVMDNRDKEDENSTLYLLAENAVILTLTIEDIINIERVGKNWRAEPMRLTGQALEQMMLAWQQSEGSALNEAPVIAAKPLIITAELASSAEPVVLHVYLANDQLLVHNQQSNLWLIFPNAISQQVLPVEIFS